KDLGLAYVHERVQKSAKKRRDAQLRDIGQQRLADMEKHSLELGVRGAMEQGSQLRPPTIQTAGCLVKSCP
ncbi:hypothetical protein NLO85_28805, partial [Pseudomonas savastanoi]|nr:hypothetical protein [Pseudomonas savastanoi]